jgi:hypothetical protein
MVQAIITWSGGPSAAANGRTTWSVSLIKRCGDGDCLNDSLSGSWTTGSIAGHPIEATLKVQGITSTGFSWGAVSATDTCCSNSSAYASGFKYCGVNAVGYAQSGNTLSIIGYCEHTAQ